MQTLMTVVTSPFAWLIAGLLAGLAIARPRRTSWHGLAKEYDYPGNPYV